MCEAERSGGRPSLRQMKEWKSMPFLNMRLLCGWPKVVAVLVLLLFSVSDYGYSLASNDGRYGPWVTVCRLFISSKFKGRC